MTRRLVADGQKPVTVGTWFSPRIVIITCIVVAATASTISQRFHSFSYVGGIVGSAVSATFLLVLGVANAWILVLLVRQTRRLLATETDTRPDRRDGAVQQGGTAQRGTFDGAFEGGGVLFRVFKSGFRLIDRPYKAYPLGVLFGLGFDTSSEIALLGIASLQGATGTSLWLILLFPALFTAGMCLLDTLDGALMMALYTSADVAKDPLKVLYFNVVLTGFTVVVAGAIGVVQVLELVAAVAEPEVVEGGFWEGLDNIGDHYDLLGAGVCGFFVLGGIVSLVLYRPWRRWVGLGDAGAVEGRDGLELVSVEQSGVVHGHVETVLSGDAVEEKPGKNLVTVRELDMEVAEGNGEGTAGAARR
ncbi:hypothetical protein MRB53_037102 [Persea americana]|nr:hypothetical protein MRB53_037102 [Persea americana]